MTWNENVCGIWGPVDDEPFQQKGYLWGKTSKEELHLKGSGVTQLTGPDATTYYFYNLGPGT